MSLTPFEAFQKFVAIRNHFTVDGYDYHLFNGKVRASKASFEKRKDAFQFDRLSRIPDLDLRIAATFVEGGKWITDVLGEKGQESWKKHKSIIQSLSYNFSNDLRKIEAKDIKQSLDCIQSPTLISKYISKQISLETLILLNQFLGLVGVWREKFPHDPLVGKVCDQIVKFSGFFTYEKPKISQLLVQKLT